MQARDYSSAKDPSLLRFLVDLRGEDATAKQLRDDLMTMLIAGHETTAQVYISTGCVSYRDLGLDSPSIGCCTFCRFSRGRFSS